MRFLLFFLCLCFSGIFFLFTKLPSASIPWESLLGNTLFESLFFLVLWFVLFFYFSSGSPYNYDNDRDSKLPYINWRTLWKYIFTFFRQHLYQLWCILFYISIYLIFSSFETPYFSYLIFFLNILVFSLFFLTDRFFILKDFLKINTILFSFIYILFYVYILASGKNFFTTIDFVNSFSILGLFGLLLSFAHPKERKTQSDPVLVSYFSLYIALWWVFYMSYITNSILLSFSLFLFIIWVVLFYLPEKVFFLKNSRKNLRHIGLIFLYISAIFSMIFSYISWENILILLTLLLWIWIHYNVHRLYQNYISFFFSFLNFFFLYCYIFFIYFYGWQEILLITNFFIVSFSFVIYTYFNTQKYIYDTYFIHIFSYIVNLFGVTLFLVFSDFNIFNLWVILLLESMFIFLSYYKLNPRLLWKK